jgi:basic membrane lipoprotein Med (substrate-binding protein (PBP1-ABC) superfamily)
MIVMKTMQKLLGILLVVVFAATMPMGCAAPADNQSPTDAPTPTNGGSEVSLVDQIKDVATLNESAVADVDLSKIDFSKIKIGVVINQSINDGGWSQAHYESFERARKNLGLSEDQVIYMENIPDTGADAVNVIDMLANNGCNMIFGTSSGFTDSIMTAAERYPDVHFHQFEGLTRDNASSYSVRDYGAIFLLGYAAARMSSGDELGFVAAQPQASVVRAINAWAAGAKYANPKATVKVIWANSWYDPAKDKESALSFIAEGINAIGYHGSTSAVMQAAGENGAYATGFHIDMHDYAPEAVLSSYCWNWTPIYEDYIINEAMGTWSSETRFFGIKQGCADIAPFNAAIMPADIVADCEAVKQKIINDEITVFQAPVKDNLGNTVLESGDFTDAEYIGMMFLLDNVIGSLPQQ